MLKNFPVAAFNLHNIFLVVSRSEV